MALSNIVGRKYHAGHVPHFTWVDRTGALDPKNGATCSELSIGRVGLLFSAASLLSRLSSRSTISRRSRRGVVTPS